MAQRPTVRWNEGAKRWMAWVRFPDGTRRQVERVDKSDAQRDLDDHRSDTGAEELAGVGQRVRRLHPGVSRRFRWCDVRAASSEPFVDDRIEDGLPGMARFGLLRLRAIGDQRVDRTTTERLEQLFRDMADREYATSTIDRTWGYLNQACQMAVRTLRIKANPAERVLLPARRPVKARKSFSIEQAERPMTEAIPPPIRDRQCG